MIKINTPLSRINFTGGLDGIITNTLRTLDTNPMANAVGIDLFAMVGPRTYVDTKERNKYAGAETFLENLPEHLLSAFLQVILQKQLQILEINLLILK